MRARLGAEAYDDGVKDGSIIEHKGSTGGWMAYLRKEKLDGRRVSVHTEEHVSQMSQCQDTEWVAFVNSLAGKSKVWTAYALLEVSDQARGRNNTGDVETAMRRCQEAYDECTSIMMSSRDASKRLLQLVPADSLAAASTRSCLFKARAMEPHTAEMEKYQFECTNTSNAKQIQQTLMRAAKEFAELRKAEQELVEITMSAERQHTRASRAASA